MKKQNKKIYLQGFHKIYFCFGFFLVTYFLLLTAPALAQFELPTIGSIKPTIILNSDPLTPLPNSTITVTASLSGITGAGGSNYVWFLNGARQTEVSGLNKNTFAFKTGTISSVYRINVNVTTPSGENLSDTVNLTVSDADLTWITNSNTPDFYRAKLMPTKNSIVTMSALPFIYRPGSKTLIGSGGLTFNWFINDKLESDKSGTGKSDLSFRVDGFAGSDIEIRLEILTEDKTISLNKFITIPVVRPQTFIYLADNKTGLPYGKALKNLIIKSDAVKSLDFTAESYFFNFTKNQLKWNWLVDNKEIAGGGDRPWSAVLNIPENISRPFSFQIRTIAKSPQDDLESAGSTANLEIK